MFTKEINERSKYEVSPFETMTNNHDNEYRNSCIEYEIFG